MRSTQGSIREKLFLGVTLITVAALLITGVAIVVYDAVNFHKTWVSDLSAQAELLGRASTPGLQFDDAKFARDNLALLAVRPAIREAAIYTARGVLFARYAQPDIAHPEFPTLPEAQGHRLVGGDLVMFHRIVDNNEIIGTVYLRARYQLFERLLNYAGIVLLVLTFALAVSLLLAWWLQRSITRPILAITDLAHEVVERRDYSLRAQKTTRDEVGYLVDAFNSMLAEIANRTNALEFSNRELAHEIGERTEVERALRDSEQRYRILVAAFTSVVWDADSTGGFTPNQPMWGSYTGQSHGAYQGSGWQQAVHPEDRRMVEELWTEARSTDEALECEARLWHAPTARYRYVAFRAVPLLDAEGAVAQWIGTVNDIDDRRRAEAEIRRLNAELEQRVQERTAELQEANGELEAFCYSVSHDLRAPLRAVDGFSRALIEDYEAQVDVGMRDYLRRIRNATRRMDQLIEDLLNLSRIARANLSREPVDMSALAREVVADLHTREPQREIEVSVWDGVSAYGDPRLLRVVLENLLGNAWKFTAKVAAARMEFGSLHQGEHVTYFVRDNGAGFDMAHAEKLFNAFTRLHAESEFPGTGIGLAIVQRIVHRHGGNIWAQAQLGKGAVVSFTLEGLAQASAPHLPPLVRGVSAEQKDGGESGPGIKPLHPRMQTR